MWPVTTKHDIYFQYICIDVNISEVSYSYTSIILNVKSIEFMSALVYFWAFSTKFLCNQIGFNTILV